MSHQDTYLVKLTDAIARQLGQLADRLSQLPPPEAAQIMARVVDPEDGVLGEVIHLFVTGSRVAKDQAEQGVLPPEVWLAVGRAANELHDIALALDEHHDTLKHAGSPPAAASWPPAPAPLVVRRRR
ncbi:hypothetical protein SLNWT_7032 [Streptomyces albus]|uniref:Uncharacterized protein n=1 Tax=Streptomyces albus (strain ATCC 21838 / DSM 41398 / FERM P-419 / JCM 4703 / NBRC 107858) TaxID=1081613 RepID=A0A0B5EX73_STRA4|nr:hypothetical protein SLNWT_7032 [Streptomyces albus]AOU81711.1 hypothetical protein SLNHY_7020 [Streptomyces albus]AYN37401.1 hypothetical protein DUI70_6908 [Streptomyces albus]